MTREASFVCLKHHKPLGGIPTWTWGPEEGKWVIGFEQMYCVQTGKKADDEESCVEYWGIVLGLIR